MKRFYEELQKRITDAIKRLLGAKYLNLWEGQPSVIEIADLEAGKDRVAYLYANPAQDDLEELAGSENRSKKSTKKLSAA